MKTVQDYLDLGVEFVKGDVVIGYKNIEYSKNWHESLQEDDRDEGDIWLDCHIKSFAWRNNDGVKPEYNGLVEVVLNSGWKVNAFVSELSWKQGFFGSVAKWRPVVLKSESDDLKNKLASDISSTMGSSGLTANSIINALSKAFKPTPPFWNKSIKTLNCPCVAVDINVQDKKFTIKEEAPSRTMTVNIEGRDYLIPSRTPALSPKEDKPMKPVYTAEMHAKNELPPVGAECLVKVDNSLRFNKYTVMYISNSGSMVLRRVESEIDLVVNTDSCEFRPIIKTIKVNGFDVPAPMSEAPNKGEQFFICMPNATAFRTYSYWAGNDEDLKYLNRRLVHSTESAAIAHAKAMLGIDPNA